MLYRGTKISVIRKIFAEVLAISLKVSAHFLAAESYFISVKPGFHNDMDLSLVRTPTAQ